MPDWLKVFVLIVTLTGWVASVVVSLAQGKVPDATMLGIPAALVIALAPPITIGRGRGRRERDAESEES